MDTVRFILVLALALVSMMLWQEWQADYGEEQKQQSTSEYLNESQESLPEPGVNATGLPEPAEAKVAGSPENIPSVENNTLGKAEKISVKTDLFSIEINTLGGGIEKLSLRKYEKDAEHKTENFVLMDKTQDFVYLTQGGLLSKHGAPTHESLFRSGVKSYELKDGEEMLQVPLVWGEDGDIRITKVFEFTRNSYVVKVRYEVENNSAKNWSGRTYQQLKRSAPTDGRGLIYTYTGAVISSPDERYEKIDFDDMQDQKLERDITNGWVAMIQHYFVAAIVPTNKETSYRYYTMALSNDRYAIGAISPSLNVDSQQSSSVEAQYYIGPKILKNLEVVSEGLELTVDYGVLWFIAKPLFLVLSKLHDFTGNWGWSIILVTILLKLIFFPCLRPGINQWRI